MRARDGWQVVQDSELIEYLSESCVMSKSVDDYGERKSSAITTARRLAAFLGDERLKDKGLVCNYVIAQCARPAPCTTSLRAPLRRRGCSAMARCCAVYHVVNHINVNC